MKGGFCLELSKFYHQFFYDNFLKNQALRRFICEPI